MILPSTAALTRSATIVTLIAMLAGPTAIEATAAAATARPDGAMRLAQQNSGSDRVCVQVISCGTKDGKRKQYPTPCAAKDDGATDIAPMTGPTCD
jgi:hypothetical protein